jgi:hypothetical protein
MSVKNVIEKVRAGARRPGKSGPIRPGSDEDKERDMTISVSAFSVVLLGVVFYCWFLGIKQRGLSRSVEMLERIQEQAVSSPAPGKIAA